MESHVVEVSLFSCFEISDFNLNPLDFTVEIFFHCVTGNLVLQFKFINICLTKLTDEEELRGCATSLLFGILKRSGNKDNTDRDFKLFYPFKWFFCHHTLDMISFSSPQMAQCTDMNI